MCWEIQKPECQFLFKSHSSILTLFQPWRAHNGRARRHTALQQGVEQEAAAVREPWQTSRVHVHSPGGCSQDTAAAKPSAGPGAPGSVLELGTELCPEAVVNRECAGCNTTGKITLRHSNKIVRLCECASWFYGAVVSSQCSNRKITQRSLRPATSHCWPF